MDVILSGGDVRFLDGAIGVGVGVDGGDQIAMVFGRFPLGMTANVEDVVDDCLSDALEQREGGLDLAGKPVTGDRWASP